MEEKTKKLEIRGFMHLDAILRKKYGPPPFYMEIAAPITGLELAKRLKIKPEEVEVIFINGFVQDMETTINFGDRVAFLPPGCPGPYRIALGFYAKNQNNPANFKINKK